MAGGYNQGLMAHFSLGYRKSLDGLRGIAVLMVLYSHIPSLPFGGGFFGVDLFFALSGFLITTLLLEEWQKSGDISLKAFYARRAIRLLPALVEVLLFAVVFSACRENAVEAGKMRNSALITLFYMANWFVAFKALPRGDLAHTWSLSVEEQFYLVWPVLLLLMLKANWSRRRIGAVVVAGILLSAGLRAALWTRTGSWERVYFGSDTHADGILVGVLLALLMSSGVQPTSEKGLRILNLAGHGMAVFLAVFFVRGWPADPVLTMGGYLAMNLWAGVLICCLMCAPWAPLRMLCEAAPLVWMGRISYGVYLWHSVILWALRSWGIQLPGPMWLLPMGVVFAVAALSYYAVERPLLRLKRRFSRVSSLSP